MRRDLNKLLCEHERRGSHKSFHEVRRMRGFSGEDAPMREGIRRRYVVNGGRKEFGEFLSPLKGQVRKACGRRYDAFYSDLCRNFDMSTPTNSHLLQHLDQYLIPPARIFVGEDGKLWVRAEYMPPYRLGEGRYPRDEFYVDPRDGIIKKVKHRKPHYNPEPVTRVEVDKDHVLHLIAGTWFFFTMKEVNVTKTFVKPEGRDLFDCHGKMLPWERVPQWLRHRHGAVKYSGQPGFDIITNKIVEKGRYAASKRTASKKMLRDAGLR